MGYWPTFLLNKNMDNIKNTIESLIPEDLVIIDYNDFSGSGKIKLIVDSFEGVDLNSTSILAKKIKKSDIINNFYPDGLQLEISSPGLDAELKIPFQYAKNIGRRLKIHTKDEREYTIKLSSSDKTGINGMDKNGKQIYIAFDDIDKAKVIIEF